MNDLGKIETHARELMDQFGLKDLHFEISRELSDHQFGQCEGGSDKNFTISYDITDPDEYRVVRGKVHPAIIRINRKYALFGRKEDIEDTIRHEIAHALSFGTSHGSEWKKQCKIVGARPQRFKPRSAMPNLTLWQRFLYRFRWI